MLSQVAHECTAARTKKINKKLIKCANTEQKSQKSPYYHTKFKVSRNKINHPIKISKRHYFNDCFSIHLNNGKRIWKGIKQIMQSTPQKILMTINKIVLNATGLTDQTSIAYAFNDYFANICNYLASVIPSIHKNAWVYATFHSG